jgi:hypothetical protein
MQAIIPYVVAGVQAAQGIVGYLGAKSQAQGLEQNADGVINMADYNAVTIGRKYQGEKQKLAFDKSVIDYNLQVAINKAAKDIDTGLGEIEQSLAKTKNSYGYGGTFSAILDAEEKVYQDKLDAIYLEESDKYLEASMQGDELSRQMYALDVYSEAEQAQVRHSGAAQANQLRAQAQQVKFAGKMNMLGSFASAAGSFMTLSNLGAAPSTPPPASIQTTTTPTFNFLGTNFNLNTMQPVSPTKVGFIN